jgi:heme/copper-type cytochrome/quinol oxidase subunit 2
MTSSAANPVWLLAWATLGIVLLFAIVMLIRFRRRNGAHPMQGKRTRSIDEIRDQHDRR